MGYLILLLYSLPEISIVIHYIYFTGAVAFQKKSLYEKTHKIPMKYKTLLDNKLIELKVFGRGSTKKDLSMNLAGGKRHFITKYIDL